jgi:hypothetical protein
MLQYNTDCLFRIMRYMDAAAFLAFASTNKRAAELGCGCTVELCKEGCKETLRESPPFGASEGWRPAEVTWLNWREMFLSATTCACGLRPARSQKSFY